MQGLTPDQISVLNRRYDNYNWYDDDGTATSGDPLTFRSADGDTALHMAAIAQDTEAVSWLLNAGIDSNAIGDMGQTALHWAGSQKNKAIVRLLLSFGASTDIVDEFGNCPDLTVLAD